MSKRIWQLTIDIETAPIPCYVWGFGDQYVGIEQVIDPNYFAIPIMTICYKWLHEKKVHVLVWDRKTRSSKSMIEALDKEIKQAHIVVGQNSDRFDVRHINTHRFLHGLSPLTDWNGVTFEDTLKKARRHFAFPSNKLDYVAKRFLKNGGKLKMEFQDWKDMLGKDDEKYEKALKKFIKYNKKDVLDTEEYFEALKPYVKLNYNVGALLETHGCVKCGSMSIHKNGTRIRNNTKQQRYQCNDCRQYAGYRTIGVTGNESKKMGS